jgi:hypothetical protein
MLKEGQLKKSPEVSRYVDNVIAYWNKKLSEKKPTKEQLFRHEDVFTTNRNIFYDTDNIREIQQESVYYCPDCQGIYQVISESKKSYGRNYKIEGISIPIYACEKCERRAYELWEAEKKKKNYDIYYLQDKRNDRYLVEK